MADIKMLGDICETVANGHKKEQIYVTNEISAASGDRSTEIESISRIVLSLSICLFI